MSGVALTRTDDQIQAPDEELQVAPPEQGIELVGTLSNVTIREDVPPDGGYGWVCCACVFLINAHTWGVNSAWGIFLAHFLANSAFPNATQLQYALIGGMSLSQSLFISPVIGFSNRKIGTRPTLLIGTFFVSLSMLTSSFATQIWQLFLSQGVCFGWGLGFTYITAAPILPQWFSKKRSLAVGIAASGAGFGGLAYNLGAGAAVESLGVEWAYRILALTTGVVNLICSILLKDRNNIVKPQFRAFSLREFGHISVLLVIIWGWFTELGYIVLLYSLPNYARSIGLSASQGSIAGAVMNLGLAFGRPVVGFLSDSFGRINVATSMLAHKQDLLHEWLTKSVVMTGLCGIFCLALWVPAKNYALLLVFALLSGTANGTFWGTVVPVTAEVVGLQRLPSAFAMIVLPLMIPTIFAEPIALQLVATSGYMSAKVFVGCMFLLGAVSMWALRSWKICDTENKEIRQSGDENPHNLNRSQHRRTVWLTPRRLFMNKRV